MGMFDFIDIKLIDDQIFDLAKENELPPLRVAINENGYRQTQRFWREVDTSDIYQGEALAVLIELVTKMARVSKGVVGLRSLYESARKVKPFCGNTGIMTLIKDTLIPSTDKMNVTCLIGDKIYLHPATLESGWRPEFKSRDELEPGGLPYHLRYSEAEVEAAIDLYRRWNAEGKLKLS